MKTIFSYLLVIILIVGSFVLYGQKRAQGSYVYDSSACAGHTGVTDPCLTDYYAALTDKYGSPTAISDIKKRAGENSAALAVCHPIMHIIGYEASKKYATSSEAFLQGDVFCWSGYYHGVMEGVVGRIGEANLPKQLDTICADIPGKDKYSFNYYNCVHGLGHGIMELKEDNLFDSLKMCDNLTGDWEQQSCYSGVFMENIVADEHNGSSDYLKASDPLYPCTAVGDKYKGQCYLGQTSYALEVTSYNFTKVSNMCLTVKEPFRDICFQSFGRDAGNQASHQAEATKNLCYLPIDPNDRQNCVVGAVKEFISFYHDIKQANDFCRILDAADQANCLSTGESYFKIF